MLFYTFTSAEVVVEQELIRIISFNYFYFIVYKVDNTVVSKKAGFQVTDRWIDFRRSVLRIFNKNRQSLMG